MTKLLDNYLFILFTVETAKKSIITEMGKRKSNASSTNSIRKRKRETGEKNGEKETDLWVSCYDFGTEDLFG